jgi:hypothetical protein
MTQSRKRIAIGTLVLLLVAVAAHQSIPHTHGLSTPLPADTEFGLGPRTSSDGHYTATLNPLEPVKVGKMQVMQLALSYEGGQPVGDAAIHLNGGMPQHGHGLPTQPRVRGLPAAGMYQVEGLKFNMGGWWVLTFQVDGAAGCDSISFNLAL